MELKLNAKHITDALFNGGFRPFDKYDYMGYADAEKGSLIADISLGKYLYQVIFTPSEGDFEVFFNDLDGNTFAWKVNPNNGEVIEF